MPAKTLLVTRPNHDLITNYLFYWAALVVKLAKKKGFKILDLSGTKANYRIFFSYVKKHHPKLVFLNGHGRADAITGYGNEIIIQTNLNDNLLNGSIVYARSCDAASILGKTSVRNGTVAFIGYEKKFILCYSPSKITKPLRDEVAMLFLEPSNLIPISLIKGNAVENAYQKSQNAMRRNFWFMLSTKAAQNQKDAAPYLWANRKNQVLLGNSGAKL